MDTADIYRLNTDCFQFPLQRRTVSGFLPALCKPLPPGAAVFVFAVLRVFHSCTAITGAHILSHFPFSSLPHTGRKAGFRLCRPLRRIGHTILQECLPGCPEVRENTVFSPVFSCGFSDKSLTSTHAHFLTFINCTCSSTLVSPIIVLVQVLVNGFFVVFFDFVYLYKYIVGHLDILYRNVDK